MGALVDEEKMIFTDLTTEYTEAWSIFSDDKTLKCLQNSMPFLKDIESRHLKIMGDNICLGIYLARLQKCLEFLFNKGVIKKAAPCIAKKLTKVIEVESYETAFLFLAQAIIRFLVTNSVILARRHVDGPPSGQDGVYII